MSLLGANICSGQNFDPGKTDLKKKKLSFLKPIYILWNFGIQSI
jgi:hypothetical protein